MKKLIYIAVITLITIGSITMAINLKNYYKTIICDLSNRVLHVADFGKEGENGKGFKIQISQGSTTGDAVRGQYSELNEDFIELKNDVVHSPSSKSTINKLWRYSIDNRAKYIKSVPYGSENASVKKIGGYSIVKNQKYNKDNQYHTLPYTNNGITFTMNADGSITANGTLTGSYATMFIIRPFTFVANHYYYLRGCPEGGGNATYILSWGLLGDETGSGLISKAGASGVEDSYVYIRIFQSVNNLTFYPCLVDLTQAFGSGYEPTYVGDDRIVQFKEFLPYNAGTISHSKVIAIESRDSDNNVVDTYTIGEELLNYLSNKGYGQGHVNDYNYIDFDKKKYYKKGSYVGNKWVTDIKEYDISSYLDDTDFKTAPNGKIELVFENGNKFNIQNEIGFKIDKKLFSNDIIINDVSRYSVSQGIFNYSTYKWEKVDVNNNRHLTIPLTEDIHFFEITATSHTCRFVFVKDYLIPKNGEDLILTEYPYKPLYADANQTINGYIPRDAKYLIINIIDNAYDCLSSLTLTKSESGILHRENGFIKKITAGTFNVRDFGLGATQGCPDDLVAEKKPLWKNLFSKWLNNDFLFMEEYLEKFDESQTIDTYDTFLKQFYPYKYVLGGTRILLSKHKGTFVNLERMITVDSSIPKPTLIFNLGGVQTAVVGWNQSVANTPEQRQQACQNAIGFLEQFDRVILFGDFNVQSVSEYDIWSENGYTLGNAGYWGEIPTCEVGVGQYAAIDNIVTKGFIFESFEVGEKITSDHNPVRATLSFETEYNIK